MGAAPAMQSIPLGLSRTHWEVIQLDPCMNITKAIAGRSTS